MLRRVRFCLVALLVGIAGSAVTTAEHSDFSRIQKTKRDWDQAVARKFRTTKRHLKGGPTRATYLTIGSAWFEPRPGVDGFTLVWIGAETPGHDGDSTYQDSVDLKVVEETPNGSVKFYMPTFPDMLPDTANPVIAAKLNDGEAMLWLRDSEAEQLMLWALPRDSLKPSHPAPFEIVASGTTATRLVIEGPKRVNAASEMGGRYVVKVVDDSGHIVTSYGNIIDPERVHMKLIEECVDGSAKLMDFMTGEGDSVSCALVSGKANVFFSDSVSEHVTLIAASNTGDLLPDTFEVDVVPGDVATMILPLCFSGTYGTVGVDKSILAVSLLEEGPDGSNNSSQIELVPFDIMGTSSASIAPSGTQTLTGGIASFTLRDSEADSGLIVSVVPSGTPELSAWWFDRVTYGFKPRGEATLIHPSGPSSAIVGDTTTLCVLAVDAVDSPDTTYDGWVWIWIDEDNDNGSCEILEYGTGEHQDIIHIQNGIGRVWITNSEEEEVTAAFEDAEKEDGPFGGYIGTMGGPEEGLSISFGFPGDSATQWVLELPGESNQFQVGLNVIATVKACDDSGQTDTTFNDTAHVQITGFATLTDTLVPVQNGIAMIKFSDDSVEEVAIAVTNAGLFPCVDSVSFVLPNTAIYLVPIATDEILVKDSLTCPIYAMTSMFAVDTTWNGVARIVVTSDPGAPTMSWVGNADSIPIVNGTGNIKGTNSEVEVIGVKLEYVSGEPPLNIMEGEADIEFEAQFWADVPDSALVGELTDTMVFRTLDAFDSLIAYTSWVHMWYDEEDSNGSFLVYPTDSFQIVDGIALVEIENTEPETVWIHCWTHDGLIHDLDDYDEGFERIIVFRNVGVEEVPTRFSFSFDAPNPFRKSVTFAYQIPPAGKGDALVTLKIYDATGRIVRTLVDAKKKPGSHTVRWDGRTDSNKKTASGVYFCKFEASDFAVTKKLVMVK